MSKECNTDELGREFIVLFFIFHLSGCSQTDEADIYFLIDHSGSIHPSDFHDMKMFIIEFLHTFRIGPNHVRMGVAKYADSPELEFDLTEYSDAKSLEKAVKAIEQKGGGTETGKALDFMKPQFDRAQGTRGHKVREYLVVITDGKSSDEVKTPAEKLSVQGVTIFAIGVKAADVDELQEISGDPKRTFFVNNFDALGPIKDNIITDICSQDGKERIHVHLILYVAFEIDRQQHWTADTAEVLLQNTGGAATIKQQWLNNCQFWSILALRKQDNAKLKTRK